MFHWHHKRAAESLSSSPSGSAKPSSIYATCAPITHLSPSVCSHLMLERQIAGLLSYSASRGFILSDIQTCHHFAWCIQITPVKRFLCGIQTVVQRKYIRRCTLWEAVVQGLPSCSPPSNNGYRYSNLTFRQNTKPPPSRLLITNPDNVVEWNGAQLLDSSVVGWIDGFWHSCAGTEYAAAVKDALTGADHKDRALKPSLIVHTACRIHQPHETTHEKSAPENETRRNWRRTTFLFLKPRNASTMSSHLYVAPSYSRTLTSVPRLTRATK